MDGINITTLPIDLRRKQIRPADKSTASKCCRFRALSSRLSPETLTYFRLGCYALVSIGLLITIVAMPLTVSVQAHSTVVGMIAFLPMSVLATRAFICYVLSCRFKAIVLTCILVIMAICDSHIASSYSDFRKSLSYEKPPLSLSEKMQKAYMDAKEQSTDIHPREVPPASPPASPQASPATSPATSPSTFDEEAEKLPIKLSAKLLQQPPVQRPPWDADQQKLSKTMETAPRRPVIQKISGKNAKRSFDNIPRRDAFEISSPTVPDNALKTMTSNGNHWISNVLWSYMFTQSAVAAILSVDCKMYWTRFIISMIVGSLCSIAIFTASKFSELSVAVVDSAPRIAKHGNPMGRMSNLAEISHLSVTDILSSSTALTFYPFMSFCLVMWRTWSSGVARKRGKTESQAETGECGRYLFNAAAAAAFVDGVAQTMLVCAMISNDSTVIILGYTVHIVAYSFITFNICEIQIDDRSIRDLKKSEGRQKV